MSIDSGDNIINGSDITARIAELEAYDPYEELSEWAADELTALRELYDDLCGIFGADAISVNNPTLVRESHFVDYARNFAEEIVGGELDILDGFIDWEGFASSLQGDYASVEFDGVTYYVR